MYRNLIVLLSSFYCSVTYAGGSLTLNESEFVAGKTVMLKLLDGSSDVSSEYDIAYADSDPTISEIKISSYNGKPVLYGTVAGQNYKLVATKKSDSSVKLDLFVSVLPSSASKVASHESTGISKTAGEVAVLKAKVTDIFGNGVAGVSVNWSVKKGNGSLSQASSVSDANGIASVSYTAGSQSPQENVEANALGKSVLINVGVAKSETGASALKISSSPSSVRVNEAISLSVSLVSASGSVVSSASNQVEIEAHKNSSCTALTSVSLSGSTSAEASAGIASFSVSYPRSEDIYIKVKGSGISPVCSKLVKVNEVSTGPSRISIAQRPVVALENKTFFPPVIAELKDSSGKTVDSSASVIIQAYTDSACSSAGLPLASNSANAVGGKVSFSGLSYSSASQIYLKASSSAISSDCVGPVSVNADTSNIIASISASISASASMGQPIKEARLSLLNSSKGLVLAEKTVTLSAHTNANCSSDATGALSGNVVSSSKGTASFKALIYDKNETIYLKARSNISGDEEVCLPVAINVGLPPAGTAYKLAFKNQLPASVSQNQEFSAVVEVQDSASAKISAIKPVRVTAHSDSLCLNPLALEKSHYAFTAAGSVSFSKIALAQNGDVYLKAESAGLASACSSKVAVGSGAAPQPTPPASSPTPPPAPVIVGPPARDPTRAIRVSKVTVNNGTNGNSSVSSTKIKSIISNNYAPVGNGELNCEINNLGSFSGVCNSPINREMVEDCGWGSCWEDKQNYPFSVEVEVNGDPVFIRTHIKLSNMTIDYFDDLEKTKFTSFATFSDWYGLEFYDIEVDITIKPVRTVKVSKVSFLDSSGNLVNGITNLSVSSDFEHCTNLTANSPINCQFKYRGEMFIYPNYNVPAGMYDSGVRYYEVTENSRVYFNDHIYFRSPPERDYNFEVEIDLLPIYYKVVTVERPTGAGQRVWTPGGYCGSGQNENNCSFTVRAMDGVSFYGDWNSEHPSLQYRPVSIQVTEGQGTVVYFRGYQDYSDPEYQWWDYETFVRTQDDSSPITFKFNW